MKILIDLNHELSPDLQVLFYLYQNNPELTDAFEARNSPDSNPNSKPYKDTLIAKGYLTTSGALNSLKTAPIRLKSLCESLVPKMIAIWKKTNRSGIAGDKNTVKTKLLAILEKNPEYANEELILNACQRYINTGIKDQYKYICELTYFVHKQGVGSRLITFCEEVKDLDYKPISFEDYGSDI